MGETCVTSTIQLKEKLTQLVTCLSDTGCWIAVDSQDVVSVRGSRVQSTYDLYDHLVQEHDRVSVSLKEQRQLCATREAQLGDLRVQLGLMTEKWSVAKKQVS